MTVGLHVRGGLHRVHIKQLQRECMPGNAATIVYGLCGPYRRPAFRMQFADMSFPRGVAM
jgi:hypothetical protein